MNTGRCLHEEHIITITLIQTSRLKLSSDQRCESSTLLGHFQRRWMASAANAKMLVPE